jgi:predicted RNA-binding protein with PIN domain
MSREYLLVDGYNIIFAWKNLKRLADDSLDLARDKLIHIMKNYQGVKGFEVILVFDAYLVKGNKGSIEKDGNIYVVYTKEAETADNYIEKTATALSKEYKVRVATSDYLEQVIIIGRGAERISANDLKNEVDAVNKTIKEKLESIKPVKNNMLFDNLDEAAAAWLEELRRKK